MVTTNKEYGDDHEFQGRLTAHGDRTAQFLDTSWDAVLPLHLHVPVPITCLRTVREIRIGEALPASA